jgi:hypothetical protein
MRNCASSKPLRSATPRSTASSSPLRLPLSLSTRWRYGSRPSLYTVAADVARTLACLGQLYISATSPKTSPAPYVASGCALLSLRAARVPSRTMYKASPTSPSRTTVSSSLTLTIRSALTISPRTDSSSVQKSTCPRRAERRVAASATFLGAGERTASNAKCHRALASCSLLSPATAARRAGISEAVRGEPGERQPGELGSWPGDGS